MIFFWRNQSCEGPRSGFLFYSYPFLFCNCVDMRASSCDKERYVVSLGVTLPEAKGVDVLDESGREFIGHRHHFRQAKASFLQKGGRRMGWSGVLWPSIRRTSAGTSGGWFRTGTIQPISPSISKSICLRSSSWSSGLAPFFCVCSNETSAFLTCSMINGISCSP